MNARSRLLRTAALGVAALTMVAACGDDDDEASPGATATANVPALTATSFTSDFSAMRELADLVESGEGKIGVLLPETTTSARYTAFDAPLLKKALETAGMSADDFTITNAQGSTATQQTQAEAAMTAGATVLILDPIDKGVGQTIQAAAKSRGVKVIDYDRLTLGGTRDYYVSFDNVKVGELIGQGFVDCVSDWKVDKPNVLVMRGDPTDNNATLFAEGYNGVLKTHFDSGEYVKVGEPAGTWDPPTAATTFQQQYTANRNINSVVMPNDANAAAVVSILKTLRTEPRTFPTTGQDAQVSGLQNVLTGYQCGTVYKPIHVEAQAAAALAIYLRAGLTPPSDLVNGETDDTDAKTKVASILLTPIWVTPENMADTVIKDGAVKASEICTGEVAAACTEAGIS